MTVDQAQALRLDPQTQETLPAQVTVLSEAIEQITRLLWAHPDACHGDYAQLQSLGLASSCLAQASKVLASDKPEIGKQLAMLRSLRRRLDALSAVCD